MITKRQLFYKSGKWTDFIKSLRIERMQPDGTIICEHCGKPIISKYDCIGHHVTELTDDNVDDVMVSLNPDNVQLVHFRCHNKIHERFGYAGKVVKRVYIVYGAPCAGKSTWVDTVSGKDDLILDIDRIWSAIRSGVCGQYDKPDALKPIPFNIRDCVLDAIRTRCGKWHNAYIVGGFPMVSERERLQDRIGADKLVLIDTPKAVCLQRAAAKSPEWRGYVEDWFDRFVPDMPPGQ